MYMTEQRKKLFEFFKSHPDMTISARDLAAQLVAEEHAKISVSAVYRNLAMLEREGLILRSPGKNNRENVYRYVSLGACEDKLHITCLKCGRTTHMTQKISDKFKSANKDWYGIYKGILGILYDKEELQRR